MFTKKKKKEKSREFKRSKGMQRSLSGKYQKKIVSNITGQKSYMSMRQTIISNCRRQGVRESDIKIVESSGTIDEEQNVGGQKNSATGQRTTLQLNQVKAEHQRQCRHQRHGG